MTNAPCLASENKEDFKTSKSVCPKQVRKIYMLLIPNSPVFFKKKKKKFSFAVSQLPLEGCMMLHRNRIERLTHLPPRSLKPLRWTPTMESASQGRY